MANNDLVKYVTSEVDFYELLGLTFEDCSPTTLRRAYRKTALKYHPDKVGTAFDPEKYELFQAANDILSDPELKSKYDNHRNAKLQRQRANELFEGKRRQMKEDLEARERGGAVAGMKRQREGEGEMDQEFRRLAEEGRKRKAARQSMMAAEGVRVDTSSFIPSAPKSAPLPEEKIQAPNTPQTGQASNLEEPQEEDEVERLERRIREAEQAKALKAQKKAEKRARKSGVFVPLDSPAPKSETKVTSSRLEADLGTSTPIKRPDIFKGLKADGKSSASPKFSFSPNTTPKNDFSATMARLKAAEKMKLEEEIRQRESETAS